MRLLAIESSCDETAAAVIEFDKKLDTITPLSSVVASQVLLHKKFGGVYPEMASRAHSQKILPVVMEALQRAGIKIQDLRFKNQKIISASKTFNFSPLTLNSVTAIAVTAGPGLVGSLLVGVEFARGLSAATGIPVVPVNHLEGHVYAGFASENPKHEIRSTKQAQNSNVLNLENSDLNIVSNFDIRISNFTTFPALALVVSGGHTTLVLMRKHLNYEIIGSTLDDAAGESFDKVARMLGLPYPGGPALEKLARNGNPKAYDFPRSMLHSNDFNFSFSGLKTAVFYKLRSLGLVNDKAEPIHKSKILNLKSIKADIAASFQQAVIDVLVTKTLKAAAELGVKSILVGGGVIANSALRSRFIHESRILNLESYLSPKHLATDNALSIAVAGAHHFAHGDTTPWQKLDASASLKLS